MIMKNGLYNIANLANMGNPNIYSGNSLINQSIAAGMPISDAMLLGAEYDVKQQQAQRYAAETDTLKREAMEQELMKSQLSQLGIDDPSDIQGNFNMFVQAGIEPAKAATIATQLAEIPFRKELQSNELQGNMQSQIFKTQLDQQKELQNEQKKVLNESQDMAKGSAEMLSDLKELKTLIPDISLMGVGADTKSRFIDPIINKKSAAAAAKFNSIANSLVSNLTSRLKGALSEKELAFLQEMVPNLSTNREGNKQIIDYMEKAAKRGIQYSKELKAFVRKGGNPEDFKEHWNDYIANNSLIDNMSNLNQTNSSLGQGDDMEAKRRRFEELKAIRSMR